MNLYTYVGNSPLNYVDPSGHEAAQVIDWGEVRKEGLRVIEGGAKGAEKGKSGSIIGAVVGAIVGALLESSPAGESQVDINKSNAATMGISVLTEQDASNHKKDPSKNIVFRALTTTDVANLPSGNGILSKHTPPNKEWTLLQHSTWGGADSKGIDISVGFDPWIATTMDLDVAKGFNSKGSNMGIVLIDLNKVAATKMIPMYEFWGRDDYEGELAYAYGTAEKEVSIYKFIEKTSIVGYIP